MASLAINCRKTVRRYILFGGQGAAICPLLSGSAPPRSRGYEAVAVRQNGRATIRRSKRSLQHIVDGQDGERLHFTPKPRTTN
jgi:hypothetical protein